MSDQKIRILVVDDHPVLRDGVAAILQNQADMEMVGEARNGGEAVERFRALRPDVTLMDLQMPGMNGVDAIAAIRTEYPGARIIVLTTYAGDVQAVRALKAGALGYLLKDRVADVAEFVESVERIATGSTVLDPEVVAQLLTRRNRDERMLSLTERERTVLALIAEGKSNGSIAGLLFLSEASVDKHITAIFQKLGLEPEDGNRRVLAALAHIENTGSVADGRDNQGGMR